MNKNPKFLSFYSFIFFNIMNILITIKIINGPTLYQNQPIPPPLIRSTIDPSDLLPHRQPPPSQPSHISPPPKNRKVIKRDDDRLNGQS